MMLSTQLKQDAEQFIDEIYGDDFIQGLINEDIDHASLIHYLQADALYLEEFANIYAMLISKTTSKDMMEYLLEEMRFILGGEVEAHEVLARAVGKPYAEIIKDGEWYPSADHYIKHMYYNAYAKENIAFTLSAMAPCPYIYQKLAEKAMAQNVFQENHQYRGWFEFYSSNIDETADVMFNAIDKEAENMNDDEIGLLRKNFRESAEHERRFFNMAMTREHWAGVDMNV
ncbi:thiaminase II [Salinicoccus jeotgali]